MIPTQEVLENLTQYRSGSYTDDHTWEEEERITPGQRIDHDKESSLSISNGSMTTYEDMSSILPSPLQFSGLETQPFLSTTSTARVEPPVKGEQKRAPLPKPTLPSSVATTVRKKNAGRKSVARKKKNQKTETNDEDLDPIADFDSDDSENGGNSNMDRDEDNESGSHAGRISRPTVRAPSPPPHPPKTGDGSLRSPSRRFILPTSATTTSHSGIRGQQGNPPDSPSSRKLRPVSEIPKPILPTALQAQQWPGSPKRRGGNSDLGSPPRKSATDKHVMTSNGPIRQPPLPTAIGTKSPAEKRVFMRTKSITDLGRSLINALPPAPLGPQLLKIAKEYERDTDQERKRRRLEEGKATDHETDKTKPSQAKEKGAAEPPPSSLPAAADLIKRVLLSKPSPLLESKAPKAPSVPMSPTRIKQEPLTQRRVPVQDTPRMEHPESPPLPAEIPLPALIIEYASKLTPIDQIKWPPAKTGQFHVFALVISIGPEEEIITKAGQGTAKRSISICDQSATSFKLDLWRERCQWADHFKTGDVVLISDVQTKEYRQKVTGNTSGWSKYCRLDGSVLASYRGHPTLETFLKVFIEKRRILGLDLMDKDKGIFRNPSLYMTLSLGAGPTAGAIDTEPGTSIRASVVYRMLKAAGDESQGWEVGACTSKGRFIKVHW
ncbi:Shieldin complex subunit 2 [Mortierella sp. GBA43]|nr:Shieldin complex subunit 2 [Mortierella sp. GBA43]